MEETKLAAATPGATALMQRMAQLAARPAGVRVRDLVDRYLAQYRGRDEARRYRLAEWVQLLGEFTLEALHADVMHAAREEIRNAPALAYKGTDHKGRPVLKTKRRGQLRSPATVNRYLADMGAVCTWAIEQRLAPAGWVHPCRGIKRLAEPDGRVRFLDEAERGRLFDACRASKYPRLFAFVLAAITTGARKSELLGLTWRDVDLAAGVALLGRTKNGDRRTLVLLPQVIEALAPFKAAPDSYVFGSHLTRYRTPASIGTAWRHAVARAKVTDFRLHDCRHTAASMLAQAGTPINVIAEVLGHRKLDMTRRYSHLVTQTKAAAMLLAMSNVGVKK